MNVVSQELEMQRYTADTTDPQPQPALLPYSHDGECHLMMNQAFYCFDIPENSAIEPKDDFMDADILPAQMDPSMTDCFAIHTPEEVDSLVSTAVSSSAFEPLEILTSPSDPEPSSTTPSTLRVPETSPSENARATIPNSIADVTSSPLKASSDPGILPTAALEHSSAVAASLSPNEEVAVVLQERLDARREVSMDEQLDFIIETTRKHHKVPNKNEKRTKARKKPTQLAALQTELDSLGVPSREQIRNIAQRIGLKEVQVYKWYWDQRHKAM
jgi:hypothetical protein